MALRHKIINGLTKPFKMLQARAFKLTYKTDSTGIDPHLMQTVYETIRKDFWRIDRNIHKTGLKFKLDHTVEEFFNLNTAPADDKLWFEAVMCNWGNDTAFNDTKQYIVLIADSDDYYEGFDEKIRSLYGPQCCVIAFNPPGMGKSPGSINNPQEYQNTVNAIVDYLSSHGIKSHKIIFLGHGYGAGIALKTAVAYHEDKQYIRVIADRGFSSSAKLAAIEARQAMHDYFKRPILKKIFGALAYYFTYAVVYICGVNLNAAAAFAKLNQNYVRGIKVSGDIDIPKECSLDSGLDLKLRGAIKEFASLSNINTHKADLQTLAPKNEQLRKTNSALHIINEWIDHFNKPPRKSSGGWSDPEDVKGTTYSETIQRSMNYMYNRIKNVLGYNSETNNTAVTPITSKRRVSFNRNDGGS